MDAQRGADIDRAAFTETAETYEREIALLRSQTADVPAKKELMQEQARAQEQERERKMLQEDQYRKHVMLKFVMASGDQERNALLPVVSRILKLDVREEARCADAIMSGDKRGWSLGNGRAANKASSSGAKAGRHHHPVPSVRKR